MIIIDSDDYAASGIETMTFPGGEPHVKLPIFDDRILFYGKLRTWQDVGYAALVLDALSYQGIQHQKYAFIPYFPGARQDRTDKGQSPLTLRVMLDLLSKSAFALVAFDPHSSVLINSDQLASYYMPSNLTIPQRDDVAGIIAPDAGAAARAEDFRKAFYPNAALVQCEKTRDFKTGQLSAYSMPQLTYSGRYIIVDDICDGGGTFNLLADAFATDPLAGNSTLEMFVSHGIFSRGVPAISSRIEHITTTDSWCRFAGIYPARLTVINLLPQLLGEFSV